MATEPLDYNTLPLGNHLQRVNVDFRQAMQAEERRILTEAGAAALEYVINSSKTDRRDQALCLKAKAYGVSYALNTYDSCIRYHDSHLHFFESTTKQLTSYRDQCIKDAQAVSLDAISASETKEAEKLAEARQAHAKSEGADYVLKQFEAIFREGRARAEREAAAMPQ